MSRHPVILGIVLFVTLANLVGDLLYAVLDPRIRPGRGVRGAATRRGE
jgi:ABC-type dipeptide/oligopeptide/nickel transport system permease component